MTGIEAVLVLAVVALAAQVLILQRHYTEKLSDQAVVLGFLLERIHGSPGEADRLDQIRDKIFNSSH